MPLPFLTQAHAPLTCEVSAINEFGEHISVSIPAERALTVYVDKRELVTLMTLGAHPELLVLGYLRNQRLVNSVEEIESITVDWDVGSAAVKTRHGIADMDEKTAKRVVTTGCGQGSVFGGLMDEVDQIKLPPAASMTQSQLYALVNTIRLKETTYKSAGSVHACALFSTTGRLTSEMVIKSAQMGVPIVLSRSGITQMGHQVAQSVGLCAIGRATNKRFVCYTSTQRLVLQPGLAA